MSETTAHAGRALVEIIASANMAGPAMIARVIQRDDVTGTPGTADDSPVGNWVLARMHARGVPAREYEWIETFRVYDITGELIAASRITRGVLHALESAVNDGVHPELTSSAVGFAVSVGLL
ncbi:hypothetical protein F4561_002681 [Lipingzhangella halophila]|uniref:Uncharacterized protein n=1 Tax=Lipingzhangella halophila TaxID=1783352 RepID=A0A7W7W2K2_9ACTN|nr:hypothetical protein [Lipingzhangella halophila]MBB4931861.1 hypothetical protein [Lipingzhangella halophila]